MKGHNLWSYTPYNPVLRDNPDIYISRVVPYETSIHFEWLPTGDTEYSVYYRKRFTVDFIFAGTTDNTEFDIKDLKIDTDYEFYVKAGEKESFKRLARCGKLIDGVCVNYLHPDDTVYSFSGRFLCSPSLLKHPDGYLLSSMDLYGPAHPQNLTLIFRSDDNGETWHYQCEIMPCCWGRLFLHNNEIYLLGASTEYGDLLIGKSTDGGKSFSAPVCLLRGSNGKNGNDGVQVGAQKNIIYNGRLYASMDYGCWGNHQYGHAAMVASCDINDDLLNPENWSFTKPRPFDHFAPEVSEFNIPTMTIEGTLAISPDNKLLDIMRFSKRDYPIVYEVDTENPEAQVKYHGLAHLPCNYSKFEIQYDKVSNKYYAVGTRLYEGWPTDARDLLSLFSSDDLYNFNLVCDLLDGRYENPKKIGFQYPDFEFDGDDIIYLCRTAFNNANSFHDTNYQTFHRIKNFRNL